MAFSYRALTCRTWKLNPVGCYDGPLRCKYSHHDTGVISPPAAITCFAWSQGTCALHEDDCLFAHLDTGLVIRDVQKVYLHEPAIISGRNAGIVRAAQRAGFDCLNIDNTIGLVNAIRDAVSDISAQNVNEAFPVRRYDHWEPAYEQRPRKGALQTYRDATRPSSLPVPPFSADKIIRSMNDNNNANPRGGTDNSDGTHLTRKRMTKENDCPADTSTHPRYSNSSTESSNGIHPARKRMIEETDPLSPSTKKLKIEFPHPPPKNPKPNSPHPSTLSGGRVVIDLTSPTPSASPRPLPSGPALATVTNQPPQTQSPSSQKTFSRSNFVADRNPHTTNALLKITNKLHLCEASIEKDRDTLRRKWELDVDLQVLSTTEQLSELNAWFGTIEEGVRGALGVLEGALLEGRLSLSGS